MPKQFIPQAPRLSEVEQFRQQQAAQQQQANTYNQTIADSGQWHADAPSFPAGNFGNLADTYNAGDTIPTSPAYVGNIFAKLQNDQRFHQLSDEQQNVVLLRSTGVNGLRQWQGLKAQRAAQAKAQAEDQGKLGDLKFAPINAIKRLIEGGELRPDPEGKMGLQLRKKGESGLPDSWEPADPFTVQHAIKAWPHMFGSQAPLNPDQQKALAILQKNPQMSLADVMRTMGRAPAAPAPGTQAHATAYNQAAATAAPGVESAQAVKNFFSSGINTGRAPMGTVPGQTVGEQFAEEMVTVPWAAGTNLLQKGRNAVRGGMNFLNQFVPWQTTPLERLPETNPQQLGQWLHQNVPDLTKPQVPSNEFVQGMFR